MTLHGASARSTRWLRRQTSRRLPDLVPACALSCLKQFISSDFPFPICPDPDDLNCLCTKPSNSGFTVGEAALRCVISSCPTIAQGDVGVYRICSGIQGARPNTHPSLTATAMATPNFPGSSNSLPTVTIALSKPTPSSDAASSTAPRPVSTSLRSIPEPTATTSLPEDSILATSTSVGNPTSAPSSDSQQPIAALTRNQIIGISVGGGVVALALFALIIFFACRRRRLHGSQNGEDDHFEIGGTMTEPPKVVLPMPPLNNREPRTPIGTYNRPIVDQLAPLPILQIPNNSSRTTRSPGTERSQVHGDEARSASTTNSPESQNSATYLIPKMTDTEFYRGRNLTDPALYQQRESVETTFEDDVSSYRPHRRSRSLVLPTGGVSQFNGDSSGFQRGQQYPFSHRRTPSLPSDLSVRGPTTYRGMPQATGTYMSSHGGPQALERAQVSYREPVKTSGSPKFQYPDVRPTSSKYSSFSSSTDSPFLQNPRSALRRSNSHESTSSVTSFETTGSVEPDMSKNKTSQRQTSQLSPVKETASPIFERGPPSPHRGGGRQPPISGVGPRIMNYSRPSFSPVRGGAQNNNDARNEPARRRVENVPETRRNREPPPRMANLVPGPLRLRDPPGPSRLSSPKSKPPPLQIGYQRQRGDLPPPPWVNESPQSPGERNLIPTRDGSRLFLRID